MQRPSFSTLGMLTAMLWSMRSTDEKFKVGACIVDEHNRVVGVGYNGRASGGPHDRHSLQTGQSGYIHAEINCLLHTNWSSTGQHTLFVTHEPCPVCAEAIANTRKIKEVQYFNSYSMPDQPRGSDILRTHSILVSPRAYSREDSEKFILALRSLQEVGIAHLTDLVISKEWEDGHE